MEGGIGAWSGAGRTPAPGQASGGGQAACLVTGSRAEKSWSTNWRCAWSTCSANENTVFTASCGLGRPSGNAGTSFAGVRAPTASAHALTASTVAFWVNWTAERIWSCTLPFLIVGMAISYFLGLLGGPPTLPHDC